MAISEKGIEFLENSITRGRPVPGQSLTNSKEQPYNWERPPDFTEPREAMYAIFNGLIEPETAANTLLSISKGVGVIDIASIMLYTGFIEGKWNPDVAFLIAAPVMKMIATMGITAGVDKIKMSMSDITNNEQIQSIAKTKVNAEEAEKIAAGVKQDIKKIESKGLMAKPEKEEIE